MKLRHMKKRPTDLEKDWNPWLKNLKVKSLIPCFQPLGKDPLAGRRSCSTWLCLQRLCDSVVPILKNLLWYPSGRIWKMRIMSRNKWTAFHQRLVTVIASSCWLEKLIRLHRSSSTIKTSTNGATIYWRRIICQSCPHAFGTVTWATKGSFETGLKMHYWISLVTGVVVHWTVYKYGQSVIRFELMKAIEAYTNYIGCTGRVSRL